MTKFPEIPSNDSDFTPDLARDIITIYQELISNLQESWYIVISDETGDYYVIPENRIEDWERYLDGIGNINLPNHPEWATYVGGYPEQVRFCGGWKAR